LPTTVTLATIEAFVVPEVAAAFAFRSRDPYLVYSVLRYQKIRIRLLIQCHTTVNGSAKARSGRKWSA